MGYRAVIFDLFGTLVDVSPALLRAALEGVADVLGVSRDDFEKADYAAWPEVGNSADPEAVIRRSCELLGHEPSLEALGRAVGLWAAITHGWLDPPRPGTLQLLQDLRGRGIKTGLITNCDATVPLVWPRTSLAPLIDVPVFSAAEGLKKPDPAIYELVALRLGCPRQACLFVGDGSSRELTGAVAAGMGAVQLRLDGEDPELDRWLERQEWDGPRVGGLGEVLRLVL